MPSSGGAPALNPGSAAMGGRRQLAHLHECRRREPYAGRDALEIDGVFQNVAKTGILNGLDHARVRRRQIGLEQTALFSSDGLDLFRSWRLQIALKHALFFITLAF